MKNKKLNNQSSQKSNGVPTVPNTIEILSNSSIFKYFLSGMVIFGICFISCLFVFQILLTQIGVKGYSMQPTINASAYGDEGQYNNDYVYYFNSNKIASKDIVIIKGGKTDSGDKIIKRIIATPGQTITFKKTKETLLNANLVLYVDVYVNGIKLEETYINEEQMLIQYNILESPKYQYYNNLVHALKNNGEFTQTLEKNQYFVLGDNRNLSVDSRYFGPISKDDILGKVILQIQHGESLLLAIWNALFK